MDVPVQRIAIIGTTGTGKTTIAQALAKRLNLPHIELDALHWEAGWQEAALPVFRERVVTALAAPSWIVDGNYGKVRDLVWAAADTLIWLDYPLPTILWQLTRRSLRRVIRQEELWNGNRETLRSQFLGQDSLFWWALQSHHRQKQTYPLLLQSPEYAHLRVLRFPSRRAARAWLEALPVPKSEFQSQ